MKAFIVFTLFFAVITQTAFARNWDRVRIPGAVCGDGLPYYVFVDQKKDSKNLLIEFMGGGACWSNDTCWSPLNIRTWIHPIPEVPMFSYMTSDFWLYSQHPFVDDSSVYFPYCTGDVFAGDHVGYYDPKPVHHTGYRNIVMALDHLSKEKIIPFKKMEKVVVWGASAGAIGALVHLENIESYTAKKSKKIAIIDSAGLHFGSTFWHKFTPELFNDYKKTFARLGLEIDYDDGFLAPKMGPVFEKLSHWNLGFMQSTRDEVMSNVFGEILPADHEQLVLSNQGISSVALNYPHVKTWISRSHMHTFLLLKTSSSFEDEQQRSAMDFVDELLASSKVLK